MKRSLIIASLLLLLASSASPHLSSALMVQLNPSSIIRQETMLDRHGAIPAAEPRSPLFPIGPFHSFNDELSETPQPGNSIFKSGTSLDSLFVDPIYRLLQVKDIIVPAKPGKQRTAKK